MDKIFVRNRHDHHAAAITDQAFALLMSGADAELILEPTTLDDINLTHLPDGIVINSDNLLLSAITTRRLRLDATMKALIKVLNSQLSASDDLVAGALPGAEIVSSGAKVVGGAIISKPRKSGLIATMTAEIPISDGQSVFIIFHAPDDDPSIIGPDDTLIAFRFLLNKRDITDIVAPHNGRDISLKQTTLALANAIERNSKKFRAGLRVKQAMATELEGVQSQLDESVKRTSEFVETAQQLRETADRFAGEVQSTAQQLQYQERINTELEAQIAAAREKQTSNVIDLKNRKAQLQAEQEQDPAQVNQGNAPDPVNGPKYQNNYVGAKYAENKHLPMTELTKRIRLAITEGKKNGAYPADLKVGVTTTGSSIELEIRALPAGHNVYSDEYVQAYIAAGSNYPTGVIRYSPEHTALLDRLADEANQYNMNKADGIGDDYQRHFYTFTRTYSALEKESLQALVETAKAAAAKQLEQQLEAANAQKTLPAPTAEHDGTYLKPIELGGDTESLALLGETEITAVSAESLYALKDGLHYFAPLSSVTGYKIGAWDFGKSIEDNLAAGTADPQEQNELPDAQPDANTPDGAAAENTDPVQQPQPISEPETQPQPEELQQDDTSEPEPIATDPEAVTKAEPAASPAIVVDPEILEAQKYLDAMLATQEQMKQANALMRTYQKSAEKNPEEALNALIKNMAVIGLSEPVVRSKLTPNYMGKVVAFEAYELTNLNARIKSRRERIAELESRLAIAEEGDQEFDFIINGAPVTVEVSIDDDRLRVSFPRLSGRAQESDPEYPLVQKISYGSIWSPSNRAWQRKITTNAKRDIAYGLGFKNWNDLVAQGKATQQEPAKVEEVTPVADAQPTIEPQAAPIVTTLVADMESALASETNADNLMDKLEAFLSQLDSANASESEHSELIEKVSDRITELLEAA